MDPDETIRWRLMTRSYLACTVRGCSLPIERRGDAFVCSDRHSYDVARSGYVNLLQPQDRRSRAAGDATALVEARAQLLDAGIGRAILNELARRAAGLGDSNHPVVADLGSGTGDLLATLAGMRTIDGAGIDLSAAAAEFAARRFPALTWIVANADRRLPLLDRSVQLVLSLNARRNAGECARVLAPGGFFVVGVPAADDLIEVRAAVGGRALELDRAEAVLQEHGSAFTLVERFSLRETHRLGRDALHQVLRATYRGERRSEAARVDGLSSMDVTLATEVLVFQPRLAENDGGSEMRNRENDGR
jgi:23S rRNA (guanine745-N1)-methyltransferase